jgi:AcrR family transcriptional regulator
VAAGDQKGGRRLRPGPGQDQDLVSADQGARLRAAMTELIYEDGYPSVTVRGLVARAHVTKPTFYRLFLGKEDCFFAAYEQAAEEALGLCGVATRGGSGRADLVERGLSAFSSALVSQPASASLVMLEALAVGDLARDRMHQTEVEFAELMRRRYRELPEPIELPAPIARGVISGIGRVARWRLNSRRPAEFEADASVLRRWAAEISDVGALDRFLRASAAVPEKPREPSGGIPMLTAGDDRTLLVNAALELLTGHGYEGLSAADIASRAGVTRRRFEQHFGSVAECFSAAVQLSAAAVAVEARSAYEQGPPGAPGISRAIRAVAGYLGANPSLARLLFVEIFRPGRRVTRPGAEILSALAKFLRERLPGVSCEQSAEASVGAIWSLIRFEVEHGHIEGLPQFSPILVWFALAPSTDAATAFASSAGT